MREYKAALEEFSGDFYQISSRFIPDREWGNKKIAEEYLKKYWLPKEEYETVWKPLQDSIFINQDKTLPEMMFANSYKIIALRGSLLFDTLTFKELQRCMLILGDTHFVIIQQKPHPDATQVPLLRLKYPAAVSWQEFMSGNYISAVLYDVMLFSFFVFSNSGIWGKYVDTDAYYYALDLIGFKPEYTELFKQAFPVLDIEERAVWKKWVPDNYKERLVSTVNQKTGPLDPTKERQAIVDFYADERYSMINSREISEKEWENKKGAQEYLERFWLPEEEYETVWKPVQDIIFINQGEGLPGMVFASQYNLIALQSDNLFEEKRFKQLQDRMKAMKETHFVVIQNGLRGFFRCPLLRLKYPIDISWQELRSNNFISAIICKKMNFNIYFVFALSNLWGIYSEDDLNLIGFKPEYTQLFKDAFPVSTEEEERAWKALPDVYKSEENRARLVSTAT